MDMNHFTMYSSCCPQFLSLKACFATKLDDAGQLCAFFPPSRSPAALSVALLVAQRRLHSALRLQWRGAPSPAREGSLGQLTDDDWENIAEDVKRHFSEDGDDEYLEIALLDEQLHWPTFQEFRSTKVHLLKWADRTRANTKARERVDASGA
jgi:hypothetical protein